MCGHIIETLRSHPDSVTLYYFCHHQSSGQNNCSHVLRMLATQLIRYDTELAALVWETHVRNGNAASIDHLRKLLPELVAASPFTRIVIDGLDECDPTEHLYTLEQLLSLCAAGRCSLLISSRDEGIISRKLRSKPTISLRDGHSAVAADIEAFVRGRFRQAIDDWDLEISAEAAHEIQQELIRRANGLRNLPY